MNKIYEGQIKLQNITTKMLIIMIHLSKISIHMSVIEISLTMIITGK